MSIFKEINTVLKLGFNAEANAKDITFYSSQAQYISYYEGLLDELIQGQNFEISYITSDPNDLLLEKKRPSISPFYSKALLPITFPLMEVNVMVMTMPDLQQMHLKRAFSGTNYVYVFHALVSTHMMYRTGAFDYYDTIFCAGPHHAKEIRETEKVYGLPPKTLHEVGYYRLEKIHAQHQEYLLNPANQSADKLILIAPGWQEDNILDTCVEELASSLLASGFKVVLRPHPMTIANSPQQLSAIADKFSAEARFQLDTTTTSEKFLHAADVLICDWSGVSLEYALGTERPVLYIDLPRKIHNPEYEKLGIEPLEVQIRDQIGKSIAPSEAGSASEIVTDFLTRKDEYQQQISVARSEHVYNFGQSSEIGAHLIAEILEKGIKGRTQ